MAAKVTGNDLLIMDEWIIRSVLVECIASHAIIQEFG